MTPQGGWSSPTMHAATSETLSSCLEGLPPKLVTTLEAIADAAADISVALRTASMDEVGGANDFGDKQLQADVLTDRICFDRLRACGSVATASSEETTDQVPLGGTGYSVSFDPLDGSSIVGPNLAVGSIFGIWEGSAMLGKTGDDQVAAAYSVYGPRTILVLARPEGPPGREGRYVQEFVLHPAGEGEGGGGAGSSSSSMRWRLLRDRVRIGEAVGGAKVFAPGNLRATTENSSYKELVEYWMENRYALRYSGGMVPDVHHILYKGGGVFINPTGAQSKPKLRLLYEAHPLALVVEAAGGGAAGRSGRMLARRVERADERTPLCFGSLEEVARAGPTLAASCEG